MRCSPSLGGECRARPRAGSCTSAAPLAGYQCPASAIASCSAPSCSQPAPCAAVIGRNIWQQRRSGNVRGARGGRIIVVAAPSTPGELVFVQGYTEVEEIKGIRLRVIDGTPVAEYHVKWKDGQPDTWEAGINLSDDLVRDYEEKWWTACRGGKVEVLREMLKGGREVLSQVVDENKRGGLHFAAALGNAEMTSLLIAAGANVDAQDKDGYTPMHMAAGYSHTASLALLLEAGANPEVKDRKGLDVVQLLDNLRLTMGLNVNTLQRRMALEQVGNVLADRLYEEVLPGQVIDERSVDVIPPNAPPDYVPTVKARELLVSFPDGSPDAWVPESCVAADVLEDWDKKLEYCEAVCLLDMREVGTERSFLVKWADNRPDSFEPEDYVTSDLIDDLKARRPELFRPRQLAMAAERRRRRREEGADDDEDDGDSDWDAAFETQAGDSYDAASLASAAAADRPLAAAV